MTSRRVSGAGGAGWRGGVVAGPCTCLGQAAGGGGSHRVVLVAGTAGVLLLRELGGCGRWWHAACGQRRQQGGHSSSDKCWRWAGAMPAGSSVPPPPLGSG